MQNLWVAVKKSKENICLFLILSFFFLVFEQTLATGVLYVRPRGSNNQYEKMWIKSIDIAASINDPVAETTVDQIFFNDMETSVEAVYIFPMPENAMITKLVYWVNGEHFEADIRERKEAVKDYNEKLRQWIDPALLEYLGNNQFRLSIVPINAKSEVRTEFTYVEMLKYDFSVTSYKYLLNTLNVSPKALETVHLILDAKTQNNFKYFQSPSHQSNAETQITKISDQHYTVEYGDENFLPNKDLIIEYETIRNDIQYNLLTYYPAPSDSFGTDNFYALWVTPPDSIVEDQIIPKNIVFTADVSSSMAGERITQLKESINYFLNLLNTVDKFNIITFGTHVVSFKPDLVNASPENIQLAHDFVFQIYALGMTNIDAAIDSSFAQSFGDSTSNNLIFLTDGKPTIAETNTDTLINNAKLKNSKNVRVFSFGIGDNLSRSLITGIAIENHGYSTFISTDDSLSILVNNHFKRISKPVLTNLSLNIDGLQDWDNYPKNLSDLFWGSRTTQFGLYNNYGDFQVALSGNVRGEPKQFVNTLIFTDSSVYRFVPRLWAKSKIDYLLQLIDVYGETDELVDQIIELSLRFQILTKYTAFYVDPTDVEKTDGKLLPTEFVVEQNYPNPFNPTTIIKYSIPLSRVARGVLKNSLPAFGVVTLKIYDVLGRLIKVLVDAKQSAGNYEVEFNAKDLPSGIYFYTVHTGEFSITKKMILIR